MPDAPTTNTADLANTEYDAQRRARADAGHPLPPPCEPTSGRNGPASGQGPEAGAPPEGGPGAGPDEPDAG